MAREELEESLEDVMDIDPIAFGVVAVQNFGHLSPEFVRKLQFGHWSIIHSVAHQAQVERITIGRRPCPRLARIKREAFSNMRRKLAPRRRRAPRELC